MTKRKHIVARIDIVELDEQYGDLPASYDNAMATFAQPIPHGMSEEDIELEIERIIEELG